MEIRVVEIVVPGCGKVVEHWHDGVMVESNFVQAPSRIGVFRAVGEQVSERSGKPVCWMKIMKDAFASWSKGKAT